MAMEWYNTNVYTLTIVRMQNYLIDFFLWTRTFFFSIHFHLFLRFLNRANTCHQNLVIILCLSSYKPWSSACIWRCSTFGFCRRNGEAAAASAVCFVWWLYYRTILWTRRLGSCSSCTLRTPGSFFLSLLSISTHFFFCILFALFCFVSDMDWDAGS